MDSPARRVGSLVRLPAPVSTRFALAVLATGLVAGGAGAVLTVLLHAVQHLVFGYSEGSFLAGVGEAPRHDC